MRKKSISEASFDSGIRLGSVGKRTRQGAALPNTDAQPTGLYDFTLIRVVIVDPYNQEIRQAKMARGLFALDAVDGGCLQFAAKITRTNGLHTHCDGKWPHAFLIRGYVTGGRDTWGRMRSSRMSVTQLSSLVRFPDTFTRETAGMT